MHSAHIFFQTQKRKCLFPRLVVFKSGMSMPGSTQYADNVLNNNALTTSCIMILLIQGHLVTWMNVQWHLRTLLRGHSNPIFLQQSISLIRIVSLSSPLQGPDFDMSHVLCFRVLREMSKYHCMNKYVRLKKSLHLRGATRNRPQWVLLLFLFNIGLPPKISSHISR